MALGSVRVVWLLEGIVSIKWNGCSIYMVLSYILALVRGLGFKFGQTGSFCYRQRVDVFEEQLGRLNFVCVLR